MKFKILAALAALSVAQPASAAIVQVSLTGTVSRGFDQSGMFGAPNTDLTGSVFSLVELFDTTKGELILGPGGGSSQYDIVSGGIHHNGLPSPGSATLTINGVSVFESANSVGLLASGPSGQAFAWTTERFIGDTVFENDISVQMRTTGPLHFLDGWHSDCPVTDNCYGGFIFSHYAYLTNPGTPSSYYYVNDGSFDIDTFDVHVLSVPEPATWAMMILGFGLVGGALRRRHALA